MATWAYLCRICGDSEPATAYVSAATVAEMPASCRIVQVRIEGQWRCAIVDRDRRYAIDRMLLREVCVADTGDCPDCAALLAPDAVDARSDAGESPTATSTVHAAAVETERERLVVVLVTEALIDSPGEADMAIDRLSPHFAGATVILLAQRDDGTPRYHGAPGACEQIARYDLERLPWKVYRLS